MTRQTGEKKDLERTKTETTLPLKFLACIKFNAFKFCLSTQYSRKYMPVTLHTLTVSHLSVTFLLGSPVHYKHIPNFNVYAVPMKSE